MSYKVKLILHTDERRYAYHTFIVETDVQLYECIGKLAVWYFFSIDRVDWRDASMYEKSLLEFTCSKANDEVDGPHRHGLPRGVLAIGHAYPDGKGHDATLEVERC